MVGERMLIVYHGTDKVSASKIMKEGLSEGTYLAIHLEDAIGYGGNYVFEIAYPSCGIPSDNWQFKTRKDVASEFIVRLTKYNPSKVLLDNMVLRHKVCMTNSTEGEIEYVREDMMHNPKGYTSEELIAYAVGGKE